MSSPFLFLEAAKILTYSALSFLLAMWWAPALIRLLKWLKFWKKKNRTTATTGEQLEVTKSFYNDTNERKPRAGGILIWLTTLFIAFFFWFVLKLEPNSEVSQLLNFVDRRETFIPIGTMFFGAIIGLIDDSLGVMESGGNYHAGGLKLRQRIILVAMFSLAIGIWFYSKLNITDIRFFFWNIDLNSIPLPFDLPGGLLIIPIVLVVLLALFGSSVIDGFDGITIGTLMPIYMCYAALAFSYELYDIATFMMVMTGSMMAYLWYNIPPARFVLGDTGSASVLLTLGTVALLIDAVDVLPIAGLMLLATLMSNVIQVASKKIFKRKVFKAAPLHHHFEAIGWTREQTTMRYWLISLLSSALALAIGLLLR